MLPIGEGLEQVSNISTRHRRDQVCRVSLTDGNPGKKVEKANVYSCGVFVWQTCDDNDSARFVYNASVIAGNKVGESWLEHT